MHASKENLKSIGRLGPQAAFDVLRKNKTTRWVSDGLILQAVPRQNEKRMTREIYGLCVSVSKKTAARAHDRNRIKRRLKAIAAEIMPVYAKPEMDYMITGRSDAQSRAFGLLRKDLMWCLKKLELLKNE